MRFEAHAPSCVGRICPVLPLWDTSQAGELRVASDRRELDTFVTARRLPSGNIQLSRLPLNTDCQGALADVGAAIAVPAGAVFEPVSLGGKPALVYVDTGNLLKVVVP